MCSTFCLISDTLKVRNGSLLSYINTLLDISLPDEDGFSLLREVRRQSEVGVIMVTGKAEDVDRIVALEMGADDYVVKPFHMRELFARTKNLLRRAPSWHMWCGMPADPRIIVTVQGVGYVLAGEGGFERPLEVELRAHPKTKLF